MLRMKCDKPKTQNAWTKKNDSDPRTSFLQCRPLIRAARSQLKKRNTIILIMPGKRATTWVVKSSHTSRKFTGWWAYLCTFIASLQPACIIGQDYSGIICGSPDQHSHKTLGSKRSSWTIIVTGLRIGCFSMDDLSLQLMQVLVKMEHDVIQCEEISITIKSGVVKI